MPVPLPRWVPVSPALTPVFALALALAAAGVHPVSVRGQGTESPRPVRNVILFVGDGMGVAAVTAARVHRGALEGREIPASGALALDAAPRAALVHTWSLDHLVTDSAAAATALATGRKTVSGALSVVPGEDGGLDTVGTLLELAEAQGRSTGLVTTTRITHATPAAFYSHDLDRGAEVSIAAALVPGRGNPRLGDGVEVLLGGGRDEFLPRESGAHGRGGRREDGRDLPAEMEAAGYRVVEDAAGLDAAVAGGAERVLGLFAGSHLAYESDRAAAVPAQPSLAAMTRAALRVLSRNPRGFFLVVEGGRIDHALHENRGRKAITDLLAFDDAVAAAREALDPAETVILVTADHDHTLVLAGYPPASADVFTQAGTDVDGKPYTALLFADGPGALAEPPDSLSADMLADPEFRERAGVPLRGDSHGGMDVPLFAWGPRWVLDRIPGSLENTAVSAILEAALTGR